MTLSVSIALTASFEKNIHERLEWLGIIIGTMDLKVRRILSSSPLSLIRSRPDLQDPEIFEVAPKIVDVLQQRMQGAYMQIAEKYPGDPALRKLSALARQIGEIKTLTA